MSMISARTATGFFEAAKEGLGNRQEQDVDRLKGKVALITGAASGQGAAEARRFVAEGAKVVIADLNEADGRALAEELGAAALFKRHDVTDEATWASIVDATVEAFGRIDILVNNAGVYRQQSMVETDVALMDLHYRVNVLGPFMGMKAVHSQMREQGGGAIVNIASIAALGGNPGIFAYTGSKWAVRGMSRAAAQELAADGIRVNAVFPGLIDTPMLASNSREYLDHIAQMVPMKRLGTSEDVAEAVVYLASDEAAYVTGAELTVGGGLGN